MEARSATHSPQQHPPPRPQSTIFMRQGATQVPSVESLASQKDLIDPVVLPLPPSSFTGGRAGRSSVSASPGSWFAAASAAQEAQFPVGLQTSHPGRFALPPHPPSLAGEARSASSPHEQPASSTAGGRRFVRTSWPASAVDPSMGDSHLLPLRPSEHEHQLRIAKKLPLPPQEVFKRRSLDSSSSSVNLQPAPVVPSIRQPSEIDQTPAGSGGEHRVSDLHLPAIKTSLPAASQESGALPNEFAPTMPLRPDSPLRLLDESPLLDMEALQHVEAALSSRWNRTEGPGLPPAPRSLSLKIGGSFSMGSQRKRGAF